MFLHSVAVQSQTPGADGIFTHDLAVNPLSVVLLVLRPLNDTGTLASYAGYLGIAQAVNRATILHRGEAIVSMSGLDIAAMAYHRYGIVPMLPSGSNVNNERAAVILPIILGKFPYDVQSCFPASKRGELIIELDLDIADTGYDALTYSIETIELLDIKPKEYERKVTTVQTLAAVGDNDIDIPPGNLFRGFLCFGTTGWSGATPAPTLGRLSILRDNQQVAFSSTDFEVALMLSQLYGRQSPVIDGHKHGTTVDGNAQTSVPTLGLPFDVGLGWQQFCYLDCDPTRDDRHAIETKGASRLAVRTLAEAANLVRVVPVERILVPQ